MWRLEMLILSFWINKVMRWKEILRQKDITVAWDAAAILEKVKPTLKERT